MALIDTRWKRLKQIDLDGVKYDICVTEHNGLYRAAWVCTQCCEQGAWAPVSATSAQASELAQIGLRIHHYLAHRPSGLSK
jgi:hypothetical protein